jgi:choline dehydrogenase-like flavoprotein
MVALEAARAGMRVVVLEAGSFITPSDMTQREDDMFPKLFWDSGARTNTHRDIHIYQGKGIGGSTLHNLNLIRRIPEPIIKDWIEKRGLSHLQPQDWERLYGETEQILSVSDITEPMMNRHNRLLQKGCETLGWKGGLMRHNRTGCIGSGFCEVGCAYDAKNNACKVLVPEAVKAGAEFITHCFASKVLHEKGKVTGVEAFATNLYSSQTLGKVLVKAERVCLSASATGTAAIIKRSDIRHPDASVGETLRIHPAVLVAGEFEQPVRAWEGVPQAYECTEYLDFESAGKKKTEGSRHKADRLWIINAFAHPMGTATLLPGHGANHASLMARYDRMAVFTAMLHDNTAGSVNPKGDLGLEIDYRLNSEDREELQFGLKACAKLLLAAGATKVIIPTNPTIEISGPHELDKADAVDLSKTSAGVAAVHPMGTVPMGDNPQVAAVDSRGRFHHLDGLWVADGSLFPTSIGVAPQLSIYSLGLHVGRSLVQKG